MTIKITYFVHGTTTDNKKEFLEAVRKIGEIKYNFDSGYIFEQSKFLKEFGVQRRLEEFF